MHEIPWRRTWFAASSTGPASIRSAIPERNTRADGGANRGARVTLLAQKYAPAASGSIASGSRAATGGREARLVSRQRAAGKPGVNDDPEPEPPRELYALHRQGLFTLALSIPRRRERAEDAVHEAFVKLCAPL